FFSSRRRHTRFSRDWSSDVCSSDLAGSNTNAAFDFYINGIHDIETMYLFLDLKQLETTSTDISDFSIIRNGKKIQLKIPEYFYRSEERRVGKDDRFQWSM